MFGKKDMLILTYLRRNARITLTNLSKKTRIPISTLFDKLKLHEKDVIIKHTALFDFAKLGYNTKANIILKVNKTQRDELKDHLAKHQNINTVYRITNGFDFMIEGIFKNIVEMEDFIDRLEDKFDITEKKTFYVIDDIKREEFLTQTELLPIM